MGISPEIINFISTNQFKSISFIEKFSDLSVQKEFNFDYSISLQTNAKLSTIVDIFVSEDTLLECFVLPLKSLHSKVGKKSIEPIEVLIRTFIPKELFAYSSLSKLLPDGYLRDCIKNKGCYEYFKIKYSLEDKFIKIETDASYRTLILKRRPRVIQPKTIHLSLEEVDYLLLSLETSMV